LKKDASEIEATAVAEHEHVEEIGPILGRKKKQKKTKPTSVTATSTPAASRPPSPKPTSKVENSEVKAAPEETAKKAPSPEPKASPKAGKAKDKPKDTATDNTVLEVAIPEVDHDEMETEKPIPTPSAVLHDLLSHGEIPEPDKLAVFKTPASLHQRTQDLKNPADSQDVMEKLVITEEDRAALLSGRPVHKVAQGSHRIMLTPNGDCVRNLTPAEEERYLELQRRIYEEAGPTAFLPSRYNANNGFTLISHRAVPNGPPSFLPPLDGAMPSLPLDPVSKIQRDEALSYINQYVLPSLSTNSQLERALNANALDADMLRPSENQNWGGWNGQGQSGTQTDGSTGGVPYGGSKTDGILASGLESMTAHFAIGRDAGRGPPLGNVTLLSLPDSEAAMQTAKKETDKLEKSLNQLLKKNRRLLLGAGH
jgi:CCR4-NOT transcription complex subunit 4